MNSPNAAKRVLLAVLGAVAGAASVTSTVSHGVPRPAFSGGTDTATGLPTKQPVDSTPQPTPTADTGHSGTTPATTKSRPSTAHSRSSTATAKPTPVASSTSAAPVGVSGDFAGASAQDGPWGSITVTITVKNNRIVDCAMQANVYDRQSQFINNQMTDWNSGLTVPEALKRQTLKAQSARISGVSGATYTSYAYAESLASALAQAGL